MELPLPVDRNYRLQFLETGGQVVGFKDMIANLGKYEYNHDSVPLKKGGKVIPRKRVPKKKGVKNMIEKIVSTGGNQLTPMSTFRPLSNQLAPIVDPVQVQLLKDIKESQLNMVNRLGEMLDARHQGLNRDLDQKLMDQSRGLSERVGRMFESLPRDTAIELSQQQNNQRLFQLERDREIEEAKARRIAYQEEFEQEQADEAEAMFERAEQAISTSTSLPSKQGLPQDYEPHGQVDYVEEISASASSASASSASAYDPMSNPYVASIYGPPSSSGVQAPPQSPKVVKPAKPLKTKAQATASLLKKMKK